MFKNELNEMRDTDEDQLEPCLTTLKFPCQTYPKLARMLSEVAAVNVEQR